MTAIAEAAARKKAHSDSAARRAQAEGRISFALPLDTPPMEARSSEQIPDVDGPWQYEPKWDGFRCLAFKAGDRVDLRAKSGKPLGRYFPEIIDLLREVAAHQFVVDGELVIELEGRLAFDAASLLLAYFGILPDPFNKIELMSGVVLFGVLGAALSVARGSLRRISR